MTDNEIIEQIKVNIHLAEYVDDSYTDVPVELLKSAFDIINRQKAEIERLKQDNSILSRNADTAFQDGLNESKDLYAEEVKSDIKSEAIKEFAERLKAISHPYADTQMVFEEQIDILVKKLAHEKEKRQECIENGICIKCRKRPADNGYKSCLSCRTQSRIYNNNKNRERGALPGSLLNGIDYCRTCGAKITLENKVDGKKNMQKLLSKKL